MPTSKLNLWLALSLVPGIGPIQFARIKERFPDLNQVFAANERQLRAWEFPERIIPAILNPEQHKIDLHLRWAEAEENHILCLDDAHYPALLKQIYAPPPLLFIKGKLDCLQCPQIAMVGSRNPSHSGRENAFHFARELAQHGWGVTSGLALGIDAASHEGALSVNGHCVAVMGTGLDKIYPARHQSLASAILRGEGAWVSEFPLGTQIKPENFPRRNRIISGLSVGVFVVEAALHSGSLITAQYGLEQGREVYAMPGSIHNPLAKGCHYLLKQGAKLVETVSDLVEEIHLKSNTYIENKCSHEHTVLSENDQDLDADARSLLKWIDFVPASFDTLVIRSCFLPQKVSYLLSRLELQGYILKEGMSYVRVARDRRVSLECNK